MFLDTTVLIDLVRRSPAALAWSRTWPVDPACSELSRVDVLKGVRPGEDRRTEDFLDTLTWIPVTERISRAAGRLGREWRARGRTLSVVDLVIAATALDTRRQLVTSNLRDFPMFPDLKAPY